MCGSVIVTGGLFLFVMNIYNYHMLKKEARGKDREQDQKVTEDQNQVVEMKQTPEAAMGQTEPEVKEENGAQKDPCQENSEVPN